MLASLVSALMLPQALAEISSFAFVHEDGSMTVGGYLIHLYGIYIPPTDQTCYQFIRPMPCGSRASLALDFRISGDFVHCIERARNPDGSLIASCSAGGQDLSEWMLQKGWAVALPDAPFQYAAMEKIARAKGIGVWGNSGRDTSQVGGSRAYPLRFIRGVLFAVFCRPLHAHRPGRILLTPIVDNRIDDSPADNAGNEKRNHDLNDRKTAKAFHWNLLSKARLYTTEWARHART